jgi:hypothetical protein
LIVYAKRGIDDLSFRYVGAFSVSAPFAVLLAIALGGVDRARDWRVPREGVWAAIALGSFAVVAMPDMSARYPGANWVADAERFLDTEIDESTMRVMRFPLEAWPGVAGVVEQSRRTGDRVCIEEPGYGFLFDESMVCTPSDRVSGVVVQGLPPGQHSDVPVAARFDGPNLVLEVLAGDGG